MMNTSQTRASHGRRYLELGIAAGVLALSAHAQLAMTFSFSPTLDAGADTLGLAGSTMTFAATIPPGATYVAGSGAAVGIPYAGFSAATVTITGASVPVNNGTFAIQNSVSLGAFPKLFGGSEFFTASDGTTHSTALLGNDGIQYEIFDLRIAASFVPAFSASVGDLVQAADFDGVTVFPGQTFAAGVADVPQTTYNIPGGVTITVVPEPAGYLMLAGAGLLAWRLGRRASERPARPTPG